MVRVAFPVSHVQPRAAYTYSIQGITNGQSAQARRYRAAKSNGDTRDTRLFLHRPVFPTTPMHALDCHHRFYFLYLSIAIAVIGIRDYEQREREKETVMV